MRSIVWFKKDLRVTDHEPLHLGSQAKECIGLYVVEPKWISSFEFDPSHWNFLKDSLENLKIDLAKKNINLVIRFGEPEDIFRSIRTFFPFQKVYAHQETGLDWTFQRDKRVARVLREIGVEFFQKPNFGVIRALKDRDLWAQKRHLWLNREDALTVKCISQKTEMASLDLLELEEKLKIIKTPKQIPNGGSLNAQKTLSSFLGYRFDTYLADISRPQKAELSNSRLSPYLSFGNISIREVHRAVAAKKRYEDLSRIEAKNLWAFENRLWWHCHFIQKLEDEPSIEWLNMNKSFDGLRENEFDESLFRAWCMGQTGFPLIDATMRCLLQTGWINFRMRAMLVSFASYHLWLHWLKPAQFLAKHFLDFEPGIHFSQIQMQSGVTGINAIRIYSPEKQVLDNDPEGEFIRRYCPELAPIPNEYLHQPELTPPLLQMSIGCRIGIDYPFPIVDSRLAYSKARERIYKWKSQSQVKAASKTVYKKHGSRDGKHFPKQKR